MARVSACAPLSPPQCVESTPRLLCGSCAELGSKRTGKPTFSRVPFAGGKRLGRLLIERECIARRASALGHRGHHQRAPECSDGHFDRVPRANHLRGLYALAVHMYPSPKYSPGRRAPRLEHAGCPEPFVDPHLIHSAMIASLAGYLRIEEQAPEMGARGALVRRSSGHPVLPSNALSGHSQRPLSSLGDAPDRGARARGGRAAPVTGAGSKCVCAELLRDEARDSDWVANRAAL